MYKSSLQTAVDAYQSGNCETCIVRCDEALIEFPDDETLFVLKGMALQDLGRYDQAADIFRSLTVRQPDSQHHWSNLGLMLRYAGDYAEAEGAFERALALAPSEHDVLLNYGLLLLDMSRVVDARQRLLQAHEIDPASPAARIYGALACFECGDARTAELLIAPSPHWHQLDSELRHDLAMALIQVGNIAGAERVLDPDAMSGTDPGAIARLAMLHERTNRLESARALLDRIRDHVDNGTQDIRVDALTAEGALALRAKDYDSARRYTEELLKMKLPAQAEANAYFTLARISDRQGFVRETMAELAKAHDIHFHFASQVVPEIAFSAKEPLRIASKWMSAEECLFPMDPAAPGLEASPVFIVGFPRSGTTMLEQMLDAHPAYVSMDERTILQRCIEWMEERGLDYPHDLARLTSRDLAALRDLYWTEVRQVADLKPGQILVDKNPLYMLRLPMIRRLFPAARVICALRHPCDVILSCYMQNFRSPAFMVLCSTLERLAKSYVNSMRFWIHHQPLLCPDAMLLRYEDTVGDFAAQVARIADYLDIQDRHYLEQFSEHAAGKGYISTPSYSQVIEPVNARAVARWQPYRDYFEPVFPIIEPIATHWGYPL
jgi:tetratricopeptide (TPR) repeat protein